MKPIFLIPVAALLGGCALFAPKTQFTGSDFSVGQGQIAVVTMGDSQMIAGETMSYGGESYSTFIAHDVDPATHAVRGTSQYVMVDGRTMECHQSDCATTVAQYHEGPAHEVMTAPDGSYYIE